MSDGETGQVSDAAAEVYEQFFIPALFEQWTPRMADAAGLGSGQRLLDVACGTGIFARAAAELVGQEGSVVGLDVNDGMLEVARMRASAIEWRLGRAEAIPFDDQSFDVVACQFGLMFFEDQPAAISEMARVLRTPGTLVVSVWDSLEHSPGYASMTALLQRLFGDEAASAMGAPFCLGDVEVLRGLFVEAGLPEVEIHTREGTARFPSIESWVYTDIKGWTLADMIDDKQYQQLLGEAKREFLQYVTGDGTVAFPSPAHLAIVTKR